MQAERLPGIRPPSPVHVIYHYVHPMDECPNGGAEWRVTFGEIAPGLLDIRHPNCARCFAEPRIDSFEVVDGPAPRPVILDGLV
jgi:hypothetical protein